MVATRIRYQALGAQPHTLRRCPRVTPWGCSAKARPAACSDLNFSVPPVPPAGCFRRSNPGAGPSSEDAIKGRTLPVEEGGGGFAGTLAECRCERLLHCKWGFSSVAQRLVNVSGSTSVAPTSSPHHRRFSGTRSPSCTACARRTPTGDVREGRQGGWAAGTGTPLHTLRSPARGPMPELPEDSRLQDRNRLLLAVIFLL